MAKERVINTRIWNDSWFDQLDPTEKLLFLYFLTNSYTNISGIYEVPLKVVAVETGIDLSMVLKIMTRLKPKIYYQDGWVIIPNFPKYQNTENPKIMAGIQRELANVPSEIYSLSITYGYPITLNLTKLNLSVATKVADYSIQPDNSDLEGREPVKRSRKVTPEMQAVFDLFTFNPDRFIWKLREVEREAAAILWESFPLEELRLRLEVSQKYKGEKMCPQINTPSSFLEKMPKMENFLKNL